MLCEFIDKDDIVKINEELKKYSVKLWDRPQIVVANKSDMLYDDNIFEDFKKKVQEMGFDKVFKMSAAISEGVDAVMKEAARMLKEIPITELEISEDGTVEMEIKSMTEPDNILPENKSIFLSITSKKDTDVSLQYTYDTYGKEGALFCCELKEKNGVKTTLEPLSSFYLSQTSEENYKIGRAHV